MKSLLCALLFLSPITLRAAGDPIVGSWKLNLAKSNPAAAATFRSLAAKIESRPDGLKVTEDEVTAQGISIHSEFTAKFDGMDYPVTGDPYADTVALKRSDPNHVAGIWKKGGALVITAQNVISTDGKTWTETIQTRDPQGRPVMIIAVFDRQ